jgi:ferrochelatase
MSTGVLILGFGGPDSLESVGPFMCNLMGREPSEELVERVCRRYLSIGGSSPIADIAVEIAEKLAGSLEELGVSVPVGVGMRYWHPYIADTLRGLKEVGCDRVVTVSMSPFESKVAQGAYRDAVAEAVAELGIEVVEGPLVSELPEYVEFFAGSAASAIMDVEPNDGAILAFTAHSLPESDLVEDDPYVSGLRRVADAVADRLGLVEAQEAAGAPMLEGFSAYGSVQYPRAWFLAYQSKGNKPGAWLGPELEDLIDAAAAAPEVTAVIAVPIGFLTDHMETLYDLDIVAAERALDAGLEWQRASCPNADETVIAALAKSIAPLL